MKPASIPSGAPGSPRGKVRLTDRPWIRAFAWAVLVATAAIVFACGGGGQDPAVSPSPSGAPLTGPLSEPTDESVEGILGDSEVTAAEYERAFFAYLSCLDENGVPYHDPELRQLRDPPRWHVSIGPYRQDESEEVAGLTYSCRGRFLLSVEMAWESQEGPSESERQEQYEEVVRCFNERTGLDVPDFDTLLLSAGQYSAEQAWVSTACRQLILEGNDIFRD